VACNHSSLANGEAKLQGNDWGPNFVAYKEVMCLKRIEVEELDRKMMFSRFRCSATKSDVDR
jgi:hypothetical protein